MIAAAACLAFGACGGDDEPKPEDEVRKVVKDYLTAMASGNAERACGALTNEAQEALVEEVSNAFGGGADELSCGDALQELSADVAPEAKPVLLNPKIGKVTIEGSSATAEVEKVAGTVPLRRVGDDWRVEKSVYDIGR
jgi:hypothetical protein